ncbi:Alkaline phosphatase [Bathymodiolus thermophilus thioautotrophic gill symbiont]|uniref:beta strand repeat-containing protein n=1 Tax=Bathymodiolus thermophilus thioautotrophic gill symbiont TaxID=2360 RepID=UPI0010B54D62|nr:FG-GAP repeat protein [Bathymodiolus thermophilus thioautotrophic gill symbiont]SGZ73104.1 Alkaline phosphatase [Bathymodiolus thermophilus thioautotrophic gill symbiont]
MQIKTQKQITILQNKAQKVADQLNEEVVAIAKGIQHIQTQTGVAYQLNTKDFDTKKLNLIAKKVGDDLEVALEESVVIFDNYFNVCTTDLSCLVSLPTKDGGLYHIVADAFFTLEDDTRVVYFYGEQSIVSTESSAASTGNKQSFFDVVTSNIGIVAAVAVVAVVVATSGSDKNDNDNEDETSLTFTLADTGGATNDTTITVSGMKEGATWQYSIDGGASFTDGTGSSFVLREGTYAENIIQIKQTDTAGNTLTVIKNTSPVVVDTTNPLFTSATTVDVETNTEASETIYEATATDNNAVTYTLEDGNQKDKFTISKEGELKYKQKQTTAHNDDKVTIIVTDVAGNKTKQLITVSVKDSILTTSVVWNNIGDDNNINIEELATVTLSGTVTSTGSTPADLNIASIVFKQNNAIVHTINTALPVINNNTWTLDHDNAWTSKLVNGNCTVIVNLSANSNSITGQGETVVVIDIVIPGAPVLSFTDTGLSNDGVTKNGTMTVSDLETGATWQYSIDGGTNFTSGTGSSFILNEGTYTQNTIQIKQTDVAGNVSSVAANTSTVVVDTTDPLFLNTDNTVSVEINSTVTTTVYDAQVVNHTGGNADEGITYSIKGANASKFSITTDTGIVTYKTIQTVRRNDAITIVATDVAGNESLQDVTVVVVNKPIVQVAEVNATENEAKDENQITVKAELGSKVTITFSANGKTVIKIIESASGNHDKVSVLTVDELNTLGDGLISISAVAVKDGATSSAGTGSFTLDTVAPIFDQQPTAINTNINTPITTTIYDAQATDQNGNADEGITYSIKDANNSKFTITTDTGKVTYKEIQTSVHSNDTVTIIATDTAGNATEQVVTVSVVPPAQGFVINGKSFADNAGFSVSSAGDVNGDGLDDLIVGAPHNLVYSDPTKKASESYVIFGKTSATAVNSSDIASGTGGFIINGEGIEDLSGWSVSSAGDVNGDGLDDLIVSATWANHSVDKTDAGKSYVVFGKIDTIAVDLSNMGTGGFVINGENKDDQSGHSVSSAGDVNGDGLDDLIIGAPITGLEFSGNSYVVFGKANTTDIDLSDVVTGMGGFVINGGNVGDFSGYSVSSAGDVNGDGLDDLIIGASRAKKEAGKTFVVFGKQDTTTVNLSDVASGTGGFAINGERIEEQSGWSVSSIYDINGDNLDDLVIGSSFIVKAYEDRKSRTYVVFGKKDDTDVVNLSDVASGTGGFVIISEKIKDHGGYSVSSAGDVNGDGVDDLIIGAHSADNTGKSYVVFGKSNTDAIDLSDIAAGTGGFAINGEAEDAKDDSGFSVSSAGDVNGDGLDDLIIGTPRVDPNGDVTIAGKSHVVFGKTDTKTVYLADVSKGEGIAAHTIDFQGDTNTDNNDTLTGTSADELFVAGLGNDVLRGNGGTDVFNAGAGDDTIIINDDNLAKLSSNTLSSDLLARVDGGGNTDTLKLEGGNLSLDLTNISSRRIQDIEIIDLTGSGNNILKLNLNDLLDISSSTNVLKVIGNSGDKVDIELNANDFTRGIVKTEAGIDYYIYSNINASTAKLWVDQDLDVI